MDQKYYKNIISEIDRYLNVKLKLENLKVIRSQRILPDFSEWLASELFNCTIAKNKNEKGWDMSNLLGKYQVKHHCKSITNKNRWTTISNYNFDFLVIIIFSDRMRIKELYLIDKKSLKPFVKKDKVYWDNIKNWSKNKCDFKQALKIFFE
jgi:hypothetical protein